MIRWVYPALTTVLLLALFGCSSSKEKYEFDKRDTSQYHQNLQIVQYYLPDIPSWANFSQSGSCKRKTFIRFFNLRKLRESFAFSYEEAIQFQYMFNQELIAIKDEVKSSYLLYRDEERIFSGTRYREVGATRPAETALQARGRLVSHDQLLTLHPAEVGGFDSDEGRERRAVLLAAHRAVAVGHRTDFSVDFVANAAAEAASLHHLLRPPGPEDRSYRDECQGSP